MNWSAESVQIAGNAFLRKNSAILDNIRANVQTHSALRQELTELLFFEKKITFAPPNPETKFGIMLGILAEGERNCVRISNPLFEQYLKTYIADFERKTCSYTGV